MEQLQTLAIHRNVRRAMDPFLPRLLKTIATMGCGAEIILRTSVPIQKAMVMMSAQPVNSATTKEDIMANGTALVAFEASSAIVADDSKPETTQTGVKKHNMKAQPLGLIRE
jgi:hypothetical protein